MTQSKPTPIKRIALTWRSDGMTALEHLMTFRGNAAIQDLIEMNSVKIPFSGCWIWVRSLTAVGGYGQVSYDSYGTEKAHRLSYVAFGGHLASSRVFVCHACDTPCCVNPYHLFEGSSKDNFDDMISKGRGNYARTAKAMRKLTPQQVLEIRAIQGLSNPQISERYGVSITTIRLVRTGAQYRDIK